MAKNISIPFQKRIYKTSLSSIDFDKIHKIMDYRIKWGYSAYECSFLLGKNDFFFRDAENPLNTKRYNPDDTNYIQLIFQEDLSAFMSPIIKEDIIHLEVITQLNERRKTVYEISIRNDSQNKHFKTFIEEDKHLELPSPLNLSTFDEVKIHIGALIEHGFFEAKKTALEIFNACREYFGTDFHPRYMIAVLNHYTNKKSGIPILDNSSKNDCGRKVFWKPFDFSIDPSKGDISRLFFEKNISTFIKASRWVNDLPYSRNENKNNQTALFTEKCGTCSTKHALLKRLSDENGHAEPKLMLGIFKMNAKNTPAVKEILKKYKLEYIPEAHNYLKVHNNILDCTGIGINETKFKLDLLEEIEIEPNQITEFKVQYHRHFLDRWLKESSLSYSLEDIWSIREECIAVLGNEILN
jgi:hypothetical protein